MSFPRSPYILRPIKPSLGKASFLDNDYIIEISEKRVEQYRAEFDKLTGRISNLLIIYTLLSVFLTPIITDFFKPNCGTFYSIAAWIYLIIFGLSAIFGIAFFFPIDPGRLRSPYVYYSIWLQRYKPQHIDANGQVNEKSVNIEIQRRYIEELEALQGRLNEVYNLKKGLYNWAFVLGMATIFPYLICIRCHIMDDVKIKPTTKVRIENIDSLRIFVTEPKKTDTGKGKLSVPIKKSIPNVHKAKRKRRKENCCRSIYIIENQTNNFK